MGFALLCFAASGWSAEPIAVQQHDVTSRGMFGLSRTVRSETLILPNANAVLRAQGAHDRRRAQREAQNSAGLEQKRQSDARRQAEADAMSGAAPAPAEAASAETAILEASDAGAPQPAAEGAVGDEVADAPVPVSGAASAATADEGSTHDAAPGEVVAPAEADAAAASDAASSAESGGQPAEQAAEAP